MKREEVLSKLDYFYNLEKKAENDFYNIHIGIIDGSELPKDKKEHCLKIMKELAEDTIEHANILSELKIYVQGGINESI